MDYNFKKVSDGAAGGDMFGDEERARGEVFFGSLADSFSVSASVSYGTVPTFTEEENISFAMPLRGGTNYGSGITAADVADIVRETLSGIRIYVLESDITDAQKAVCSVVENSLF